MSRIHETDSQEVPSRSLSRRQVAKLKRQAEREALKLAKNDRKHPQPTLSHDTRVRLINEALTHPVFEGMERAEVEACINERLTKFLSAQPCWWGRTELDGANGQHR